MDSDRGRVFAALHEIAVAVGGVLEPAELARLVVERARALVQADAAGVYVLEAATQMLNPIYSSDVRENEPEPRIPLGRGAAGQAALGQPVVVDDYQSWPHAGDWAAAAAVRSAIAVPLQVADRRIGAISVRTYAPRHWSDDDTQTLTLLAAQIAPVLEAAQQYERTQAARINAEAAARLRDEVLTGVSHDLAGPLTRIRLYAELIQSEVEQQVNASGERLADWSGRIIATTSLMREIMQELVDVARLQMGQSIRLDLRPVDLLALVRRLARDQEASGRRVNVIAADERIEGMWDEARLARVMANLVENAINYSPEDTDVDVVITVDGHSVEVRVVDRGRGIGEDDLPHVFERFYRGANARADVRGSGVGLANARQIIESHGGTIEIASQPGEGTSVIVRLPRHTDLENS